MVRLTRLNGKAIVLNALLIESIEETPDTMITLVTGKKIMVLEPVTEVMDTVHRFLQTVGLVGGTVKSLNSEGS
ncbi:MULTISPECIES: flagellar FlbD family protein [Paenibacillus]|uniref:Flagellar protein D n=4 Tax=Paenibacillus TaxID=44249 RepID=A0A081PA20_9BACL|nr:MULTISPECIES: flagellar FlbD family protein [Paenibacillus]KEQ27543.1 flagellar protein D [Paenibacillus tyrfis]KPV60672.1 flagellar protein D [Paenibacillus sp. A3]KZE73825.1 flagellar protein D [Paenibacillus elgii]MBU7317337.1 flagellar FlbD family protein [Paenibacillus oleatilyticus]MCM3272101.1 flagellar FlbD family protein [Paenibacillus elgii]